MPTFALFIGRCYVIVCVLCCLCGPHRSKTTHCRVLQRAVSALLETGDVQGARSLATSLPFPPLEVPMVEAAQQLLHRYAYEGVAYLPDNLPDTAPAQDSAVELMPGPAAHPASPVMAAIDGRAADQDGPSEAAILQQAVPRAVLQFLVRKKLLQEGDWHVQRVLDALAAGCRAGGGRGPCQRCVGHAGMCR